MPPVKPQVRRPGRPILPRPPMAVDATMQFTATAKDASGEKFQWSSSAPSVATIDGGRNRCWNDANLSDCGQKNSFPVV